MIIKFTPSPGPENVDMAWMQMQSLLNKHLPVQQKRKNVILFISKIAAVFILLLQIPVAFQMGSINISQVSNNSKQYVAGSIEPMVNKAYRYKEKISFIKHAHAQVNVFENRSPINTESAINLVLQPEADLERKSGRIVSIQNITEDRKVFLSLPSNPNNAQGVDVQFAVQSNLPLHIQDMVSNDQQRIRAAQYLDIPLNVTIPVSAKVNLHAGVQVSYLQSIQTKDVYALSSSANMPSVSTLVVPVSRSITPVPNLSEDISVKNINRGINAGLSYKTGPGEVGVLYQYGSGQIYGMQGNNLNRHTISISFKCPIK